MTNENTTGVYIAYSRAEQFRIAHSGPGTLVNRQHTRVGFTTESFAASGREYREAFGNRVKFIPIAEIPRANLQQFEKLVLATVGRAHPRVGASAGWFDTQDRASIISLIYRLLTPAANEPTDDDGQWIEKTG